MLTDEIHVGYILKQYPRLSETFILNEILGLESEGVTVSVVSLRPPTEGRFHAGLAEVKGAVHYVASGERSGYLDAMRTVAALTSGDGGAGVRAAAAFVEKLPPERQARVLFDAIATAENLLNLGVTHVHAHFMTVAAHTAHIVHLLTGLPYTVTAHAKDIYRSTVDWDLARTVAERATAVVTVCDANVNFLSPRLADPRTTIVRIYNGLGPQGSAVGLDRREPGLILGVGRLVEKKGFDVLLECVAKLATQRPEIRCVLVGDGDQRQALEARAETLGIAGRVVFTGAQPQDEVARWLRRAHVLAAPCQKGIDGNQDALPTVLLEALGAGLPAVTTPVAGIPEIIDDEREGLVVAAADPSAMVAAIERLLDDAELWTAMSAAGPIKLAARFNRSMTVAQLIDVIARGESVR